MSIEIIVNPSEGPSGGNENTVFIKQRTQLRRNKHTCPAEKPGGGDKQGDSNGTVRAI